MKKTLTIITLMTLVACGKQSDINKLYDKIDSINDRIAKLESDVDGQASLLNDLVSQVNNLSVDQDALSQSVALNAANLANLQGLLYTYYARVDGRLNEIEGRVTVKELYNPCGSVAGQFEEYLMIMSDGSIMASFEGPNGTRYNTKLLEGINYKTTDGTNCYFRIENGQVIELWATLSV